MRAVSITQLRNNIKKYFDDIARSSEVIIVSLHKGSFNRKKVLNAPYPIQTNH